MRELLAIRSYRSLLLSSMVVVFGVMGQAVGRGWLARELIGSNTGLGGVMLVFGAAMLLASPWGGVAADRMAKRAVLLASTLVLAVSSLWIGVAVAFDSVAYWMLLVASAMQAVAFAFFLPARIAFISELVDDRTVREAVVLGQMSQEAMRVGAPALAGLLIGVSWFGVAGVFLMAGALCTLSLLMLTDLPSGRGSGESLSHSGSSWSEFVESVAYVRRTPGLALIALSTISMVVAGFPYMTFLPTLADEQFGVGASGYGLMSGAAGLGAIVAGAGSGRLTRCAGPWRSMALGGGLFGAGLVALGLAPAFGLAVGSLFVIGAGALLFQTTGQAMLLERSEPEYHGRMQSMVVVGFSGFGFAAFPLGAIADAIGAGAVLALMGVTVVAIAGRWTAADALRRHSGRGLLQHPGQGFPLQQEPRRRLRESPQPRCRSLKQHLRISLHRLERRWFAPESSDRSGSASHRGCERIVRA